MIHAKWFGRISVPESEEMLDDFMRARAVEISPDMLCIFEHTPTFVYHRWEKDQHAIRDKLWFDAYCAGYGVTLAEAHRGCGMMYHGPGQIVLAPVLKLKPDFGIPEYARALEETMLLALGELFGIDGFRIRHNETQRLWVTEAGEQVHLFNDEPRSGVQGVWVFDNNELRKIGFLGSRFQFPQGVISRGCALNLFPDLDAFSLIDPCDLPGVNVSSVERLRGFRPKIEGKLAQTIAEIFAEVLIDMGFTNERFFQFEDLTKE